MVRRLTRKFSKLLNNTDNRSSVCCWGTQMVRCEECLFTSKACKMLSSVHLWNSNLVTVAETDGWTNGAVICCYKNCYASNRRFIDQWQCCWVIIYNFARRMFKIAIKTSDIWIVLTRSSIRLVYLWRIRFLVAWRWLVDKKRLEDWMTKHVIFFLSLLLIDEGKDSISQC